MIVMGGYLENPKLVVAATGILIQTTSLMYTVPTALAECVSARVCISILLCCDMLMVRILVKLKKTKWSKFESKLQS